MNDEQNYSLDVKEKECRNKQKPLKPPEYMVEIGSNILSIAKELMNNDTKDELFISVEYRIRNIETHIDVFQATCDHKGCILKTGYGSVLVFNLLFFELLSDLLLFQTKPDQITCEYVLSKYSRLIAAIHDRNVACFYNWLLQKNKSNSDLNNVTQWQKSSLGCLFILLHEWVHVHPDFITLPSKLFITSEDFLNLLGKIKEDTYNRIKENNPNLDEASINNMIEERMVEVYCDFSALVFASILDIDKLYDCTKTELVGISLMALSIPGVYNFLKNIRINGKPEDIKAMADTLLIELKERIQMLIYAVKISCNSKVFFGDCDASIALKYGLEPIQSFINECGKYYIESIKTKLQQFNQMTDEEREKYSYSYQYFEWDLFA